MSPDKYEDFGYSRRRRRHQRHVPVRLNRRMEFWAVIAVSLAILVAGVSWMWSLAYPTGQQLESLSSPGTVQGDQSAGEPAVIIIEDKSGTRNDPPTDNRQ